MGRGDALVISTGWVVSPGFLPRIDFPVASCELLEGYGALLCTRRKLIRFCYGRSLRIPSGGCPAGTEGQHGRRRRLRIFYCLFLEAEDDVTHSPESVPDILIGCKKLEYRHPSLVDANKWVLSREVALEAMVLTNSLHAA